MTGRWIPHDTRDDVVDFVRSWSEKCELPVSRLLPWVGIGTSKFHDWKQRFGKVNEHNAWVPRDHWLTEDEKDAGGATTTVAPVAAIGDAALNGANTASASAGVEGITAAALLGATFTDANIGASSTDFAVEGVDWGDGGTSAAGLTISGSGGSYTVGGSHLYAEDGVHSFKVIGAPCKVLVFQRVKGPPGNWSLQPEAIGAAVEVTKPSKPSMERIA